MTQRTANALRGLALGLALAGLTVLLALVWPARGAERVTLRFTTPAHDAVPAPGGCEPGPVPLGPLGEAELWGWTSSEVPHVVLVHPAGAPGAPDSFVVDEPVEQTNFFVQARKATGVPGCPSNLVTLCGRVDVPTQRFRGSPWLGVPRPNPTAGLTAVAVCLAAPAELSLDVLDVAGRCVARPLSGPRPAGIHIALWDARGSAPGIYVVRASAMAWQATRRVLVLR